MPAHLRLLALASVVSHASMVSLEFLLTSFVVVLIPGTGVLFTVSTGLLSGRRAAMFAALGCTAGILPHLAASVLGLAALLHLSATAFHALKFAGAAYLLYLAWGLWRSRGWPQPGAPVAAARGRAIAWRALLVNILNPKLSLFFLAFMPQFVPADAPDSLLRLLLLSGVFMVMTLAVFLAYGLLAHSLRQTVLGSPRLLAWLQRSFAAVFAFLGLRLALAER